MIKAVVAYKEYRIQGKADLGQSWSVRLTFGLSTWQCKKGVILK